MTGIDSRGTVPARFPLSSESLIDRRSIARLRDRLASGAGRLDPGGLGLFELGQGFRGCAPDGGALTQIGNVGDVTQIFFAIENIDVLVFHDSSSRRR